MDCKLKFSRGSIYLVGAHVNFVALKWIEILQEFLALPGIFFDNREKRDGPEFHLTIVKKFRLNEIAAETGKLKEVLFEEAVEAVKGINLSEFVDFGIGKSVDGEGNLAYFVVVSFEKLGKTLKSFLPSSDGKPSNFHITLAFNRVDVHSNSKDLSSLMVGPINQRLLPNRLFVEEVKNLVRSCHYEGALKMVECVKENWLDAEIMEIKALVLFKLSRYEECAQVAREIMKQPKVSDKFQVLASIRLADALISSRKFKMAINPIWRALNLLNGGSAELTELKTNATGHLIGLLQKCSRHGFMRIDAVPVNRKAFQEIEADGRVEIEDFDALESFEIYKKFIRADYETVLDLVAESYGEIAGSEEGFDEDFMPLEVRWICASEDQPPLHALQRNFSYLWPNRLAVSSTPRHAADIKAMADLGVSLVITLTEEEPLKPEWFLANGVKNKCTNLFLPVPNYNPPSVSIADRIVWEVARLKKGTGLIHCGGGKGRAGTAAAIVIMTLGMDPNNINLRLCEYCQNQFRPFGTCPDEECHFSRSPLHDPNTCLRIIRRLRPESLETEIQEAFLKTYSSVLWQRHTFPSTKVASFLEEELEEDTMEIFGAFPSKPPRVIILSGLPGSGKTTFSKILAEKLVGSAFEVDHVNRDAIGGRDAFENALGASAKRLSRSKKFILIVDRCNARKRDRKAVLDLLHNPEKDEIILVHFATSEELCLQRIEQRFDHLTLKPEEGKRAIRHFSEILEMPDHLSEGAATLLIIKSLADSKRAIELLCKFVSSESASKIPSNNKAEKMDNFYKFPRTEHLFNLGGATRDDLVLSPTEFKAFFAPAPGKVITMEEKIDGANVGFSMDENGKILCQNRSHYVDSKYHFQFQSLGSFIYQKRESLERILKNGRILYGEWMFAKHSIHYTSLPDIFIAFDLFDPKEQKFADRQVFRELMASTNISYVQPLPTDPECSKSRESLEFLLKNTKSSFSDSIIEGIYFRWDQNGKLKTRAKLVRSDFINGDEHWSKGKITLNISGKV